MLTDGSLASCYGNQRFSQLKPFLTALKMSVIGTFKWPENKQPLCSLALKQKAFSVSLGRKEERKQSKSWKSSVLRGGKVLGPGFSLMGEAVGHFVTQMTQFGVIPWEHPWHPSPSWGFPAGIVWGGLRAQQPGHGQPLSPGVQESLSFSWEWQSSCSPWHCSKVQVQAGFESGAPSAQARGDGNPNGIEIIPVGTPGYPEMVETGQSQGRDGGRKLQFLIIPGALEAACGWNRKELLIS